MTALPLPADVMRERILTRVEYDTNGGCWLMPRPYARLSFGGGANLFVVGSHRLAHMLWNGPIPAGLVIDHKCRTPECCNPAHLRVVTPRENTIENSVSIPALNAAKTHCKRGHPFTPENTYRNGAGRACKACNLAHQRRTKPRRVRQPPPRRTHCLRGHPLTPENTLVKSVGRACRTCTNAANRARLAKLRARKRADAAIRQAEDAARG